MLLMYCCATACRSSPTVELTVSGPRTVRKRTAAASGVVWSSSSRSASRSAVRPSRGDLRDGLLPEEPQLRPACRAGPPRPVRPGRARSRRRRPGARRRAAATMRSAANGPPGNRCWRTWSRSIAVRGVRDDRAEHVAEERPERALPQRRRPARAAASCGRRSAPGKPVSTSPGTSGRPERAAEPVGRGAGRRRWPRHVARDPAPRRAARRVGARPGRAAAVTFVGVPGAIADRPSVYAWCGEQPTDAPGGVDRGEVQSTTEHEELVDTGLRPPTTSAAATAYRHARSARPRRSRPASGPSPAASTSSSTRRTLQVGGAG